ncbi:MAG: hypothetical protein HZC43_00190 [Nitrosomonadales bacterium]|nr:hypothetical protein [Nitrosomonadales bacterium]
MNTASHIRIIATVVLLAPLHSGCGKDAGNPPGSGGAPGVQSIGRMKVSIMPEYDDPSVLAIYDGKFDEAASYPIRTSFLIPKGSVISDACSLSHEGQHFCQLYKTVSKGVYDEVSLVLPYPNFYLSFHTPQLDVQNEKKEIAYRIRANHPVRSMEVDLQQPLRSTAFSVSPPENASASLKDGSISVIKGFNHVIYKLEGVATNQEVAFGINYLKSDPKPSVDIKYSSMKETQAQGKSYEGQRNIRKTLYAISGTGMLGVLALIAWRIRSRKKRGGQP